MNLITITGTIAIVALVLSVLGVAYRLRQTMNRPFKKDLSRARGSVGRAVLYAFTLGMAPWEKESTRIHWLAYFRGILFHVGVFMALAVLLASPWLAGIPRPVIWLAALVTGVGAVAGFAGIVMRWADENLRRLSLPDDYFSLFLTSLFVLLAFAVLLWPALLPVFYLVSALMLLYIPFSKIRHCAYFFYTKFFFGLNFGRRGVIGQPRSGYSE
jgi:hypothetical protein